MLRDKKRVRYLIGTLTLIFIGVGVFLSIRARHADKLPVIYPTSEAAAIEEHKLSGFTLQIDKIEVKAPIINNVNTDDEKIYLKAIENGVAHYRDTALLGEKGNAVIFGHSSYYKDKPGDYKEVFKRLNELKPDDTFSIVGEKTPYEYKVTRSAVIKDDDFSVVEKGDKEIVTILTCWPPGSVAKRWVVQGERVNASSSLSTKK